MPLQPPPADVAGFPARRSTPALRTLYRIFSMRGRDGSARSVWHFTSGANRFDVDPPHGTCYWSDRRYGAWVEVFRGAKLVDVADASRRRICTGSAPALRLANLLSRRAYLYGVTAAVSTQPDYVIPQQWAKVLLANGFSGVVGTCSHDPSSTALNVAVFGRAGTPRTQAGWRTTVARLETDPLLLAELASLGVHVATVPFSVPITPPPSA